MVKKLGSTQINKRYLWSTEIKKSFLGNQPITWLYNLAPRTNLVGEWLLDWNALDTAGSNDGTATNVSYVSASRGYVNEVGSFNGSTSYVSIPDFEYNISTKFSYNAWIYLDNYTTENGIVMQDNFSRWTLFRTSITTGKLNFVRLNSTPSVVTNISSISSVPLSTWTMVTATFDNTVGSKIYINGNEVANDQVLVNTNNSTENIRIWSRNWTDNLMDWSIWLVRIYNKALSQQEITQLYNEGLKQ